MSFNSGFKKEAIAKWQKMWPSLSKGSQGKLRRYAGEGGVSTPKNLKKMRDGMFNLKQKPEEVSRRNKVDKKIYDNALRNDKDIRPANSRWDPFALKEPGKPGYASLPKRQSEFPSPTAARSVLEHERSELKVERLKSKRGAIGKKWRGHKAISDGGSIHSSAHPLIAEANIAGRTRKATKGFAHKMSGKHTPGQAKAFGILKQHGWTPGYGLPEYGTRAAKIQKKVEKAYAPHFEEKLQSKIERLKKKYRGIVYKRKRRFELSDANQFAGGKEAKKKLSR